MDRLTVTHHTGEHGHWVTEWTPGGVDWFHASFPGDRQNSMQEARVPSFAAAAEEIRLSEQTPEERMDREWREAPPC